MVFPKRKRSNFVAVRDASTQTRRRAGGRRIQSRSGGRFSRPSRRRPIARRQRRLGNFQNRGVLETSELGISTGAGFTDAFYIGHATWVQKKLRGQVLRVILKMVMAKMSLTIQNFSDLMQFSGLKIGDTITLFYKVSQGDAAGEVFSTHTVAAGEAWETVVQTWSTSLGEATPETFFTSVGVDGANNCCVLNLIYGLIHVNIKSSLKLQNVTVSPLGDEEDNVDNIPIYGKSYYGKGTGTTSNRSHSTETTLVANDNTGLIHKIGTVASGLSEMPPPAYFVKCHASAKAKIDPGHIKTSVLSTVRTFKLVDMMKYLYTGQPDTKDIFPVGDFAFFGFEHMIKSTAADPAIKIKGEINYRVAMSYSSRFKNPTDEKAWQDWAVL